MNKFTNYRLLLLVLPFIAFQYSAQAQVSNEVLANAATDNSQWLSYGRDQGEQRYSPLQQINDGNVDQLGMAWTFDTGSFRGLEGTPLVVDGIMYATRPWSSVFAVDARSGELIWNYDPQVDRSIGGRACCDVVNRGLAAYGDKIYGRAGWTPDRA